MKSWYVVQTKPSCERIAVADLAVRLFDVFLPLGLFWTPGNARTKLEPKPLLGPYLFVSWAPERTDWYSCKYARGVARLLTSPSGAPAPVPDGWVEALLGKMAFAGYVEIGKPEAFDPKRGDRLRIKSGPFEGVDGLCQGTQGERVNILLDGLGSKLDIVIRLDQVEHSAKAL